MIFTPFAFMASQEAGVDPDYQAILDYATTQGYTLPSEGQQTLQNTLVTSLKSSGIWSELDFLYIMATDGDSNYARINWSNPGTFQLADVGGTPVFDSNQIHKVLTNVLSMQVLIQWMEQVSNHSIEMVQIYHSILMV
jgi:hypothetical protein